jgi:hypothetical protein
VDSGIAVVLAAAITGAFSLLTMLVQKFRKENARDHDVVMGMLKYMHKSVIRTEGKLDKHIEDHNRKI